ncbi:MAG: hypothetical protein ACJAVY_002039 [Marinoscillum sp.]
MYHRLLFIAIIFYSCSEAHRYPITEEDAGIEYYRTSLKSLNEEILSKPKDISLRKRKLLISKRLDWPEDVNTDINLIIDMSSLDLQSFDLSLEYYKSIDSFEKQLELIDYWESIYGKKSEYLTLKANAYIRASNFEAADSILWQLVNTPDCTEGNLQISANFYSMQKDSVRLSAVYELLFQTDPLSENLIMGYVPLLLAQSRGDRALEIFEMRQGLSTTDEEKLWLARTYAQQGNIQRAQDILEPIESDSAVYQRVEWYEQTLVLESAVRLLDPIIARDSNEYALFKKAQITHNQNKVYESYRLLSILIEKDSTNSKALNEAEIVARKIAYLRNLKEQENRIPVLDINSKKLTE